MSLRTASVSLVLALFAVACGNGSTTGNDAGSTTGNDAGSTTDSGGSGVTADAACMASAQAQCSRRDACSTNHYLIDRSYVDMATCVTRTHDQCVTALAAPGTGNTPDNVMACAAAYPSIACTDVLDGTNLPASCMVQVGTLAAGAACRFGAQCTSTYCNIPTGAACGTCGDAPAVGTACDGPGAVSTCGGHGMSCVGATTTPYAAGTCQMVVTTTGGTCDATHPCGAGLSCTPVSMTATNRTCQTAVSTVGAACGGATSPGCDTEAGLTCNSMTHVCEPFGLVAAGTACGQGTDGTFVHCSAGGLCMGYSMATPHGTCVAAVADGTACDRASGPLCETPSTCVTTSGTATAGTCQPSSATSCH